MFECGGFGVVATCSEPLDPANGRVFIILPGLEVNGTYDDGERAFYGCNKGFELSAYSSGCRNGTWSPTVKFTGKINTHWSNWAFLPGDILVNIFIFPSGFCLHPSLGNGHVFGTGGTLRPGRNVTFQCNVGYVLNGSALATCQNNRSRSPGVPSCDLDTGILLFLPYCFISCVGSTREGNVFSHACSSVHRRCSGCNAL